MNPISFIITCPHYDSGIKSLGSKNLYHIKKETILEKQYKSINKYCKDIEHEIILVNSIDHARTLKFLDHKNLNLKYIYLNEKNMNHAGCFLKGLELAQYETVFNIECGLIISHQAVASTMRGHNVCDISIGCVSNKHQQNSDLEIGCIIDDEQKINNIFFGLDNKYIGISCINNQAKQFILDNFNMSQDKNKYIFELINVCISKNLVCRKTELKSKDAHLIFNKKSLQQYERSA